MHLIRWYRTLKIPVLIQKQQEQSHELAKLGLYNCSALLMGRKQKGLQRSDVLLRSSDIHVKSLFGDWCSYLCNREKNNALNGEQPECSCVSFLFLHNTFLLICVSVIWGFPEGYFGPQCTFIVYLERFFTSLEGNFYRWLLLSCLPQQQSDVLEKRKKYSEKCRLLYV